MPGWDPAYQWSDSYVPYDALPSVLDPKGGYVVTANQAVTTPSYPYYIGDSYDYGYRSQRILDLLRSKQALTVKDVASIQLDSYSLLAAKLTPLLRSDRPADALLPAGAARAGQLGLPAGQWLRGCGVLQRGLEPHPGSHLRRPAAEGGLARRVGRGGGRSCSTWSSSRTTRSGTTWALPNVRENRDDILREALMQARDELTRILSRDPARWTWGALHTLDPAQPDPRQQGIPCCVPLQPRRVPARRRRLGGRRHRAGTRPRGTRPT